MSKIEGLWPTDKFSEMPSRDGYFGLTTDKLSYFVSCELFEVYPNFLIDYRTQITEYLKAHRGEQNILVATVTADEIRRFPIPSTTEKINRFLIRLRDKANGTTKQVTIYNDDNPVELYQFMRDIGISHEDDVDSISSYLVSSGFAQASSGPGWLFSSLKIPGLLHIEELQKQRLDSRTCFVAMWFAEEMNDVFAKAIAPAIGSCGYDPVRIDSKEHNNKIDDEIISEIRRSRFVIADFSCGSDGARGGVYYEAGFAHGLNIPVIFCVREKDLPRLHFDTRQFSHIVWNDFDDLKRRLEDRIRATIF